MIKLLVVEDDTNLSYMIQTSLEEVIGGYEVVTAANGNEGLQQWRTFKPDVILADIDMPEMNGFEMVEKIRQVDDRTLILFASGKLSPNDVTKGLNIGADNYIKKPFIPDEIDAYIKSLLRGGGSGSKNVSTYIQIGSFTFNSLNGMLKDRNGEDIRITARESQIIHLLATHKGEVVKRETILENYWESQGKDFYASRSLDVFISGLRKKFASDESVQITAVKGIGIKMNF